MMKFRENTAINLIVTFIFETCRGDFCISRSPKAQLKFQQVGGCSSCICSPPLLALLLPPDQNPHSLLIHPSTVDYKPQTSYLNSQHQLGGPNCSGPLSAGLHVTHFMQLHFATLRRINKDKSYTRMAEQKIGNNLGSQWSWLAMVHSKIHYLWISSTEDDILFPHCSELDLFPGS